MGPVLSALRAGAPGILVALKAVPEQDHVVKQTEGLVVGDEGLVEKMLHNIGQGERKYQALSVACPFLS